MRSNNQNQGIVRSNEEDDENISCCNDDVFYSFLHSLINEDAFTNQNPMLQLTNGVAQVDHALVSITASKCFELSSPFFPHEMPPPAVVLHDLLYTGSHVTAPRTRRWHLQQHSQKQGLNHPLCCKELNFRRIWVITLLALSYVVNDMPSKLSVIELGGLWQIALLDLSYAANDVPWS
ncbi:hypothetical protein F3Y22_tig00110556pilonHSYRG00449 [Hibiscus syriacus]|uniref:Uncharacterized protein n=1 Tax=Hibiscus syriacus TaxID=106335 RepID=A0A6A3A924_HIBSY|nr:hypothetical protein F3Y22_tig00110556pilonHSYRG00449 [Hibiscus syriacus]